MQLSIFSLVNMEYEIFYGCNVVGSLVVLLILVYHLIAAKPLKAIEDDASYPDVSISLKKSQ